MKLSLIIEGIKGFLAWHSENPCTHGYGNDGMVYIIEMPFWNSLTATGFFGLADR